MGCKTPNTMNPYKITLFGRTICRCLPLEDNIKELEEEELFLLSYNAVASVKPEPNMFIYVHIGGRAFCCVWCKLASRGLIAFVCLFFYLSEFFLDVLFRDGFAQSVTKCGVCWCFEFWWVELWGGGGFLLALGVDDSYPDAVFNVHL